MPLDASSVDPQGARARIAGGFNGEQLHARAKNAVTSSISRLMGMGGRLSKNTRP
jgi:hypothetical protein